MANSGPTAFQLNAFQRRSLGFQMKARRKGGRDRRFFNEKFTKETKQDGPFQIDDIRGDGVDQ